MASAQVVIGSAFGDEGKGATVNRLATPETVVVRFNGGAQAGHTVIHNGHRRVFSHIGSGALKGAFTHLSKFFVCHPLAFLAEWYDLAANGTLARVSVDPDCFVTTIYDMCLNQMLEQHRGKDRHGSVGVGFGETIERSQQEPYALRVSDLRDESLLDRLRQIRDEWVPTRCEQLGLRIADHPAAARILAAKNLVFRLRRDFEMFLHKIVIMPDAVALTPETPRIFEGAQGLLLDQNYGHFPYVTRSHTGLRNVRALVGDEPLQIYFVTRAYTTRHGAGPLAYELPAKPYPGVQDETNLPHPFQGTLRFSYLNLDEVGRAVRADLGAWTRPGDVARAVVTCLDQLPDRGMVIQDGAHCACDTAEIPQRVGEAFAVTQVIT